MTESEIRRMLDEVAALRDAASALRLQMEQEIRRLMPPDVRAAVDEAVAEFEPRIGAAVDKAAKKQIKEAVSRLGRSVSGKRLQTVFQIRTSWDNKALEGYATAHPEILRLRKLRKVVSIRGK